MSHWSDVSAAAETWSGLTAVAETWSGITTDGITVSITTTPASLERTTSGLILKDNFDRASGTTIGNGWTEETSGTLGLEISDEELITVSGAATDTGHIERDHTAPFPTNFIMEANYEGDSNPAGSQSVGLSWEYDGASQSPKEGYEIRFDNPGTERISLNRNQNEVTNGDLDSSISLAKWNTIRAVQKDDGDGTTTIVGYYFLQNEDTDGEIKPSSRLSSVLTYDEGSPLDQGNTYALALEQGQKADRFFLCGSHVTIRGMDDNQIVKMDSIVTAVSSSDSAVLDVSAAPLSGTTIIIADALGSTITSFTPSGGIWGGDQYTFTKASTSTTVIDGWSRLSAVDETWNALSDSTDLFTKLTPVADGSGGIDFTDPSGTTQPEGKP